MTIYAGVRTNRLDIYSTADGGLPIIGSVVVTGPTILQLPVIDYGHPGRVSIAERPAPQLWDAVLGELGYDVAGEWHAQNLRRDELLWQAEIRPVVDGNIYTVAGNPPVLTITGAATIGHVVELIRSARVRFDGRVAVVDADLP